MRFAIEAVDGVTVAGKLSYPRAKTSLGADNFYGRGIGVSPEKKIETSFEAKISEGGVAFVSLVGSRNLVKFARQSAQCGRVGVGGVFEEATKESNENKEAGLV